MDKFVQQCLNDIRIIEDMLDTYREGCSHKEIKLKPARVGEFDNEFIYYITCNSCGWHWVQDQATINQKVRQGEHVVSK